jgi:hypothetical protein
VITDVQVETVVRRPRSEVAEYAMDWRNDKNWIGALTDVRLVTAGPFGIGSRVERTARFLGKTIVYVNEIDELEPSNRLVMRSIKSPFPMTVVYEFEDFEDGTRVRIQTYGDADGFYRLAAPFLSRAVKHGVSQDLKRLKASLESAT